MKPRISISKQDQQTTCDINNDTDSVDACSSAVSNMVADEDEELQKPAAYTFQTPRPLKQTHRSSSMDSGLVLLLPGKNDQTESNSLHRSITQHKKLSHVRSMSDYGVQNSVVEHAEETGNNVCAEADSLSSSLPDTGNNN